MATGKEEQTKATSGKAGGGKDVARPITVQAYSGYKKDELPRSFEVDGSRLTILSVKQTWKEESEEGRRRKAFFRVHTHDGRNHVIAHDENTDEWTLEPFSSNRG